MATVTATYRTLDDLPATGKVYLSPVARVGTTEQTVITEHRIWAELDAEGTFAVDVIPSDSNIWLVEDVMLYLVEERLRELPYREYWVFVPEEGLNLADAQPTRLDDHTVVSVPGIVSTQAPSPMIVLAEGEPVPEGTPEGTLIVRY